MGNSTRAATARNPQSKPAKPSDDFPLFPHDTGRWAKKINGKLHYFGYWRDEPNDGWEAALKLYQSQRHDIEAGREVDKTKRTPKVRRQRATKRKRPHADFPLFAHANGYWAKKVRGDFCYFGRIADDPKGVAAAALWAEQKDDLLAGRTPRARDDRPTVGRLCNKFLAHKRAMLASKEIAVRTFTDYYDTCERLTNVLGPKTPINDLTHDEFAVLRKNIAEKRGAVATKNEIGRVYVVLNYGVVANLITKPLQTLVGPELKRPSQKVIRIHRREKGERMIEAADARRIVDAAGVPIKAMILLALNGGLGNSDIGHLPLSAIDLERGWIHYPRPKTGVDRRFPLWPETVAALKAAINERPIPKETKHEKLAFITKYGQSWIKEGEVSDGENGDHVIKSRSANPISFEFRKLLRAANVHRDGIGFYTLRHVFETIAGESKDQVAVDHVMGHAREDMASVYRERISDERLKAAVSAVRKWLFGKCGSRQRRRAAK